MNNIKNIQLNKVISSFSVLVILALGVVISPLVASADVGGFYNGYISPINNGYNNNQYNQNYNNQYNNGYNSYNNGYNNNGQNNNSGQYQQGSPNTLTIYSGTPNNTRVNSTRTTSTAVKTNPAPATGTANTNTTDTSIQTGADLTASVILGSNTLYPSGLIQWVFFAILLVLIVILIRRIYGGSGKYLETPMKHA